MDRFYRLALASDRPAQALWQAQGEFLTAAGSTDESFEIAVLQYAPFILSQNASLETGGEIRAPQSGSFRGWLAALLSIPFLCFLLSRIHLRRRSQPT
jgi:hypothetical protein